MNKKYQVSFVVMMIMLFSLVLFYQNCAKKGDLDLGSNPPGGTGGVNTCPSGFSQGNNNLCYAYTPLTRTLVILNAGPTLRGCADSAGDGNNNCMNVGDLPTNSCNRVGGWPQFGNLGMGCGNASEQFNSTTGTWTFTNVGCIGTQDLGTMGSATWFFNYKIGAGSFSALPSAMILYDAGMVTPQTTACHN
jgi:hypothetical protein